MFIEREFDLDEPSAKDLQKKMFRKYGTTMRGLMVEHSMDPIEFLHFVHDIDVSDLNNDPELYYMLKKLPGRCVIFTNGSVPHAQKITHQLGIDSIFEGVFDIVAANFLPKPARESYQKMINKFNIEPGTAIMVDDMAKNLKPASDLGMKTVWLSHDRGWSSEDFSTEHIDLEIKDLKTWLASITI
jgi:putative hydrolase of the HAD superfamily